MNKYTIKKIFERRFSFPIWKIEVDCSNKLVAIEFRNPDTTLAHFAVFDFEGMDKGDQIIAKEKEWTLDSVQGEFLILKRFGSSSPIEAGIQIIHYCTGKILCDYREYVLVEVYNQVVVARHRAIADGLLYGIDIVNGHVSLLPENKVLDFPPTHIKYPISYQGHQPDFIRAIPFVDQLWILPYQEKFIWAYHMKNKDKFNLHLQVSTRTNTLDDQIILENLERLIPQPFFAVQEYIFFLSNCKLKIKGYLV